MRSGPVDFTGRRLAVTVRHWSPRPACRTALFPVSFTTLITDAGDSGFLLPMALVGVLVLWFFHSRRLAWLLLRSVLLAGATILALKIFFLSCAAHWHPGLTSPSGHACLSAVVYGTLGTVLGTGRSLAARIAIGAAVVAFVALIALTRLSLGVHTAIEVAIGLAVGLVAQSWFAWSYAHAQPPRVDLRTFGAALAATLVIAYGMRLPAESIVRHLARRLGDRCSVANVVPAPAPRAGMSSGYPPRSSVATSSASSRAGWS